MNPYANETVAMGSPEAAAAVAASPDATAVMQSEAEQVASVRAADPPAAAIPASPDVPSDEGADAELAESVERVEPIAPGAPREYKKLTLHQVNGLNEAIEISILDEPGPGNANHVYLVQCHRSGTLAKNYLIEFQKGPIAEVGVNGLSNEALLAIVEHRLRRFQAGPFACEENGSALDHLRQALRQLQRRTERRIARGVEGTSVA